MAAGGEIGGDVRAGGMSDRTPARTTNSEAAGAGADHARTASGNASAAVLSAAIRGSLGRGPARCG